MEPSPRRHIDWYRWRLLDNQVVISMINVFYLHIGRPPMLFCAALLSIVFCVPCTFAAQDSVMCPKIIKTIQSGAEPIDGFEVILRKTVHRLNEVVFFLGHPSDKKSFMYDSETVIPPRGSVVTYSLDRNNVYWMRCGYFGTSVTLARQLPSGLTTCRVTDDGNGREIVSIVCQ